MVAKAGLGLIGLSAISVGGVALAKPHLLGMDYMPNTFHALSKDSDYDTKKANDYGTDTFGRKYRNYLVGVTSKKGDTNKNNQSWWEWAYRKLQNDDVKEGKFQVTGGNDKKVDRPYGGDSETKALNQVCKAAYKTTASNVGNEENNGKFKKDKVWKYCSPLGKEPSEVKTNEYDSANIGSEAGAKFISTKDDSNDLFWFIRDKEIKEDNNFEQMLKGETANNYFKNKDKPLKELCEEAYTSPKTEEEGKPKKDDTKKYCIFEIPGITN